MVAVKQYGSQASSLAVDASDVDLAVTGLRLMDHDSQITKMAVLTNELEQMISSDIQVKCEFIQTASVPVIKLVCDL